MANLNIVLFQSTFTLLSDELNIIKTHFEKFLSYLDCSDLPRNLTLKVKIETISEEIIRNSADVQTMVERKMNSFSNNHIASLGIFQRYSEAILPSFIKHSFHEKAFFLFINYDIRPNEKSKDQLAIAYFREFFNWLLTQMKIDLSNEEHSGTCLRTYDMLIPEELELSALEEMNLLVKRRYDDIGFKICSICSSKILQSLLKFTSIDVESFSFEKQNGKSVIRNSIPDNPLSALHHNIPQHSNSGMSPSNLTTDSQRILTQKEKTKIKNIIQELGIREPEYNEEYLEIRERFLNGKISEPVFSQHAKRLSH